MSRRFIIVSLRQAQGDIPNTNRNIKHCQAEPVEAFMSKKG